MRTTATRITRDEAKEQARERLPELLADVVPGFRPERPFRCLSPGHEDRHPSMRYLSRANMVKCFACGWSGDVFDVVGAVYGLAGGDAFRKTFDLLGIDCKSGGRRPKPAARPKADPGTWAGIVAMIWPNGLEEPEITLPMPLAVVSKMENVLVEILTEHPEDAAICQALGLEPRHFDDAELGRMFAGISAGDPPDGFGHDGPAMPRSKLSGLARYIREDGERRALEAALARAWTAFQNGESTWFVTEDVLNAAELVTGCRYDLPDADDAGMRDRLAGMLDRWRANDDPREIVAPYRRPREAAS